MSETVLPLRDKQGNEIDPRRLQIAQYAALPPGMLFATSDTVAMARLGLSDSVTAPCGGTIPTCAVADGKTVCGCGHIHPPQFHSVNLPAIFEELASLRERVRAIEQSKDLPSDLYERIDKHLHEDHTLQCETGECYDLLCDVRDELRSAEATLHLTFDDTTGVIGKPSEREGYYTLTMVDNENRTVKMRVHRDTLAQLADVTSEGVENA